MLLSWLSGKTPLTSNSHATTIFQHFSARGSKLHRTSRRNGIGKAQSRFLTASNIIPASYLEKDCGVARDHNNKS
jgi:hypothetical protein